MKIFFMFVLLISMVNTAFADIEKKGLAIVPGSISNDEFQKSIKKIKPSWYYNWGLWPEKNMPTNIQFVPMIGDEKSIVKASASEKYHNVLLFNEPDGRVNYIPPVFAAKASLNFMHKYPTINFITPAAQNPWNNWMPEFLHEINDPKKSKFEFVAVHWYGKSDIVKFEHDIADIHKKYDRDIWLTEFATISECTTNKKENDIATVKFMREALIFLEKTKYIKRYSWFSPKNDISSGCKLGSDPLFKSNGELTTLGIVYAKGK